MTSKKEQKAAAKAARLEARKAQLAEAATMTQAQKKAAYAARAEAKLRKQAWFGNAHETVRQAIQGECGYMTKAELAALLRIVKREAADLGWCRVAAKARAYRMRDAFPRPASLAFGDIVQIMRSKNGLEEKLTGRYAADGANGMTGIVVGNNKLRFGWYVETVR